MVDRSSPAGSSSNAPNLIVADEAESLELIDDSLGFRDLLSALPVIVAVLSAIGVEEIANLRYATGLDAAYVAAALLFVHGLVVRRRENDGSQRARQDAAILVHDSTRQAERNTAIGSEASELSSDDVCHTRPQRELPRQPPEIAPKNSNPGASGRSLAMAGLLGTAVVVGFILGRVTRRPMAPPPRPGHGSDAWTDGADDHRALELR